MTRDRVYRRYFEEKKVKTRLKQYVIRCRYYWMFTDANDFYIDNPTWFDLIGTERNWFYKSNTTDKSDTRRKLKWGKKNRKRSYYESYWTREADKRRFLKLLNELGFRRNNTEL